jgi:hypothetical protein
MHHARRPRDDELDRQVIASGFKFQPPLRSLYPTLVFHLSIRHPTHLRHWLHFSFPSRQPISPFPLISSVLGLCYRSSKPSLHTISPVIFFYFTPRMPLLHYLFLSCPFINSFHVRPRLFTFSPTMTMVLSSIFTPPNYTPCPQYS